MPRLHQRGSFPVYFSIVSSFSEPFENKHLVRPWIIQCAFPKKQTNKHTLSYVTAAQRSGSLRDFYAALLCRPHLHLTDDILHRNRTQVRLAHAPIHSRHVLHRIATPFVSLNLNSLCFTFQHAHIFKEIKTCLIDSHPSSEFAWCFFTILSASSVRARLTRWPCDSWPRLVPPADHTGSRALAVPSTRSLCLPSSARGDYSVGKHFETT